jgi:5-methylcytosine-specific restriction endonuclease McrA
MTDDELRQLIRAAIQKHTGADGPQTAADTSSAASGFSRTVPIVAPQVSISFGQYHLERAADDTSCLIEPAVQCNHCGFCKCHGH